MKFHPAVEEQFRKLSRNDRYDYFFDHAKEKPEDEEENELVEKLAELVVAEFYLPWDDLDKVKYFLWLAYHVKK